jgi:hypothetical protein
MAMSEREPRAGRKKNASWQAEPSRLKNAAAARRSSALAGTVV